MRKLILIPVLLMVSFNLLIACHGTGITATSYTANGDGTYEVAINYCLGVSSNFDGTNDFSIGFYDSAGNPVDVVNIVSGGSPSYSYQYYAIDGCADGMNTVWPEYTVNASSSASTSGNTVSFTNTSTWGAVTNETYETTDMGGGTVAGAPPCTTTQTTTPPFVPSAGDLTTANDCTDCTLGYGESGGVSTPVEQICFDLVVTVASDIQYISADSGFEGDGSSNCNGSVSPGPVVTNNDMQESCTNDDSGPCDGDGTTNGTGVVDLGNALPPVAPISLAYFEAEDMTTYTKIKWQTFSEIENAFFIVERSTDGSNFEEIAKVDSKSDYGHSDNSINYTYNDNDLLNGTIYYRLSDVDFGGKVTVSDIVSITRSNNRSVSSIFPMPVTDHMTIAVDSDVSTVTCWSILDLQGRKLNSGMVTLTQGNNSFEIETASLYSGMYIWVMELDGEQFIEKIIK